MILRRLGHAIARQDWFVVLIELLVLVVGIFIGLQVDDWNQARRNRNDEQRFLVALHEDILLAEQLSARLRERRLSRGDSVCSANADGYDAYVRDALGPWSDQFDRAHARLDTLLGIAHEHEKGAAQR
jgi:hypothetical protein